MEQCGGSRQTGACNMANGPWRSSILMLVRLCALVRDEACAGQGRGRTQHWLGCTTRAQHWAAHTTLH
jgi:hypothetical protein